MPGNLSADDLPLQRIYKWERERPETVFLSQPYGGGKVRDWTWSQSVAEIRRIAAWLKAQDWEPGSQRSEWGKTGSSFSTGVWERRQVKTGSPVRTW